MADNYSDPNDQVSTNTPGPTDMSPNSGPTANEAAEAAKQQELQRLKNIDKPLEQDAYDEGIMGLMGGLGAGAIKGGIMGVGKALVTGPAKQLASAVGKSALGSLFGDQPAPAPDNSGAGGAPTQ